MTSASFEVSLLSCSSKACLRSLFDSSQKISSVFVAICVRNERKISVLQVEHLRYIIAFLLAIMMLSSLCACAQTGTAGNSGELDLDYVGEDTDQPEEEKPWYSWFTEAFSFGKKDTAPTTPSKPDSVADFYAQGSGDPSARWTSSKESSFALFRPDSISVSMLSVGIDSRITLLASFSSH